MAHIYRKTKPIRSLNDFLNRAKTVKNFTSSNGKRYSVIAIKNDEMSFKRLDAKSDEDWSFDLKDIYEAYLNLENFETENFRPYVPIRHSPKRVANTFGND